MLTNIQYREWNLLLAAEGEHNIFDIDSLSLLIGPNGCGKTNLLKATIEQFDPRSDESRHDCRLTFDHRYGYDQNTLKEWGVIYYSPAPNGPKFGRQRNFVDASKSKTKNFFELVAHELILQDFGLNLTLSAKISIDIKRVSETIAEALIVNKALRGSSMLSFDYDETEKLRKALIDNSDFDTDRFKYTTIEQQYKSKLSELSLIVTTELKFLTTNDLLVSIAVTQHLFKSKKYDIQTVCWALERISGISVIRPGLRIKQSLLHSIDNLVNEVRNIVCQFQFKQVNPSSNSYIYTLDVHKDRYHFDKPLIREIFDISPPGMSSGQHAILRQIISLHEGMNKLKAHKKILVLIDEGEAFLHLQWQRQYIWKLNEFLKNSKARFSTSVLQVVIASHSPLLASDVPRQYICRMDHETDLGSDAPSFAAPLQKILNLGFESSTIGEFATRRINDTIRNLKNGQNSDRDTYVIQAIDDPIIKRELIYIQESNL